MSFQWTFFVDESGAFEDPRMDVVVAGILVRDDVPGTRPQEIREALERAAPDLHWPFHAAYFNFPVLFALASHARRAETNPWAALLAEDPASNRAIEVLERAGLAESVRRAAAALGAGSEPDHGELRSMDDALRSNDRRIHRDLQRRRQRLVGTVQRLLQRIGRRAQDRDPDRPGVMVFASGEAWRGAAYDRGTTAVRAASDRYLSLLRSLLGRLCRVMDGDGRRVDDRHNVCLRILGRNVVDGRTGTPVRLSAGHISKEVDRSCGGAEQARLEVGDVERFDRDTHPLLVFADLAANRVRPVLARNWGLERVEKTLTERLGPGVWIRTGGPARTHVASVPHDPQAAGAEGSPSTRSRSGPRAWALEQASEWR